MIKCFIVPMSDPPYSTPETSKRPLYINEIGLNWTGVPLDKAHVYVVKAGGTPEKMQLLQDNPGVIDFPNVFDDELSKLPKDRKDKNALIWSKLQLVEMPTLKVKVFINLCANSEKFHNWRAEELFVPEQ